jgi:hypothetical protein
MATPFTFLGSAPALDPDTCQALLQMLRRKEQTWVDWGKACQQLQRSGYTSVQIFEETGLEPVQQNQVIVAAQVYESILALGLDATVQSHFQYRGSDVLYEFRGLTPPQRLQAAVFAHQRRFDADQARELGKAYREFHQLKELPAGFQDHPGDALAYQYWRWARERGDLQERSRLIAQGLTVVQSTSARQQLQQLLTQWDLSLNQTPPRWPFYRLESEDGSPLILPVCTLSTPAALRAIPPLRPQDDAGFWIYPASPQNQGQYEGKYIAVPGWQLLRNAQDPLGVRVAVGDLPYLNMADWQLQESDPLLLIVDRGVQDWQNDRFYLVDHSGSVGIDWFPQSGDHPILATILLVVRPARQEEIPEGDEGDWLLSE